MSDFVRLDAADNVVTAIKPLEAGVTIEDTATAGLIPRGHKIATQSIATGEKIIKYNQVIGYATRDIAPGEHVHVDDCEFRATDVDYTFGTDIRPVTMVPEADRDTFQGYRRPDGRVGTRNYIAVLSSVNCSATACKMIADHFGPEELAAYPNVDGVVAFTHGTGCGNYGEGMKALQNVMWGYARHPNVGGVVMVGLGCEGNQIEWLMEAFGLEVGPRFQWMNIQNVAGLRRTIEAGIKKVEAMLPVVNDIEREACPASELTVALQCGGSDAWSGVTANPAVGYASDLLVAQGGTTVLGETPEIYGAEHLLAARADEATGKKLLGFVQWWEDYTRRNYATLNNNPSPGNKAGGLTTILEKSYTLSLNHPDSPMSYAALAFDTAGWHDDDLVPVCVLQTLLGGGDSFSAGGPGKGMYSRLYTNVLNRFYWVESATAFTSLHNDAGLLGIYGATTPEHTSNLLAILCNQFLRIATQPVHEVELSRAKNQLKSSVLMNLETRSILYEDIGRQLLTYGHRECPQSVCAKIDRVSENDLLRVAKRAVSTVPSVVYYGDLARFPTYEQVQGAIQQGLSAPYTS